MLRISFEMVRRIAEDYCRNGDYYCSEFIVRTIRDEFGLPVPDSAIAMASGLPVGFGASGCMCGAVAGGLMALGLFFGRDKPKDQVVNKCTALPSALHDVFREKHSCLCCRMLTRGMELGSSVRVEQCVCITGEVREYSLARQMRFELPAAERAFLSVEILKSGLLQCSRWGRADGQLPPISRSDSRAKGR